MGAAFQLLLLAVQSGLTFAVLLATYWVLALLDYQGGFSAFVGLFLFQPVMGALLALATMGVCVLVGLPLRLADLGRWWRQRPFVALAGAGGVLLLLALFLRGATPAAGAAEPSVLVMAASGWFLLAFCLLHVFPPNTLLRRLRLAQ